MKAIWILLILVLSSNSWGGIVNINTLYFSDTLTTSTSAVTTRTQYDLGIGIHIGSKKMVLAQLLYGSYSAADTANSITQTYSVTDMGINFGFYIGKARNWIFDIAYMLISKAKYNDGTGGTGVEWRGTAIKADFGYLFDIDENFQFSTKLYYYSPSFTEQVTDTTTLATVSYRRATIYPGFALYWVF